MTHDLTALETWASTLLAQLAPAARRKLTQQIANDLRRSQQQRIKAQQTPEGIAYTPRKQRKAFKNTRSDKKTESSHVHQSAQERASEDQVRRQSDRGGVLRQSCADCAGASAWFDASGR